MLVLIELITNERKIKAEYFIEEKEEQTLLQDIENAIRKNSYYIKHRIVE